MFLQFFWVSEHENCGYFLNQLMDLVLEFFLRWHHNILSFLVYSDNMVSLACKTRLVALRSSLRFVWDLEKFRTMGHSLLADSTHSFRLAPILQGE